jgi:hypothetical protein
MSVGACGWAPEAGTSLCCGTAVMQAVMMKQGGEATAAAAAGHARCCRQCTCLAQASLLCSHYSRIPTPSGPCLWLLCCSASCGGESSPQPLLPCTVAVALVSWAAVSPASPCWVSCGARAWLTSPWRLVRGAAIALRQQHPCCLCVACIAACFRSNVVYVVCGS